MSIAGQMEDGHENGEASVAVKIKARWQRRAKDEDDCEHGMADAPDQLTAVK